MSAALVTVAIAMHVRCASCGGTILIGALVGAAPCPSCGLRNELGVERWRALLDTAVHDAALAAEGHSFTSDVAEARVEATRRNVRCGSCETELRKDSTAHGRQAGKCFCTGCGAKIGIRPVPGELAAAVPGITHLVGEDLGQLKNAGGAPLPADRGVVAQCPECGGGLSPDGHSRAVRCSYCRSMVALPQTVWSRLHPQDSKPHVFYLVHDPAAPRAAARADLKWSGLDKAIGGPDGCIYGIGEDEAAVFTPNDGRLVFALDPHLRTRWVRRGLELDDDSRLAVRPDGTLLLWTRRRYSALLLRAADGADAGKLGGKQATTDCHSLDFSDAESVAVDHDGTVILSKLNRIARCLPTGQGVLTWPPRTGLLARLGSEKLSPFPESSEDDSPFVETIGDYPTRTYDAQVRVGWDGYVYLLRSRHIARFDRTGKKIYTAQFADDANDHDFGADARGFAYALRQADRSTYSIWRVSPDGSVSCLVDGRNPATPIRDDDNLIVRPDGSTVVIGSYRCIRVFAPDGRPLWRSEEASKEDRDFFDEAARRASNDEVD